MLEALKVLNFDLKKFSFFSWSRFKDAEGARLLPCFMPKLLLYLYIIKVVIQ